MLAVQPEVHRRLVDIDRVGGQRVAQRRGKRNGMDARACLRRSDSGAIALLQLVVRRRPACVALLCCARDHATATVPICRTHGFGQQTQRGRHVTRKQHIRAQILIGHVRLERTLVDHHDLAGARTLVRRIPRRAAADRQHQVGVAQQRIAVEALVQRMILGERSHVRGRTLHHRNAEQLGQFDERLKALARLARRRRDDHGIFRRQQKPRDVLDVRLRRPRTWRG